jgi:hypothetical protein
MLIQHFGSTEGIFGNTARSVPYAQLGRYNRQGRETTTLANNVYCRTCSIIGSHGLRLTKRSLLGN